MEREDVSNSHRSPTTSAMFGRRVGYWCKQRSIIFRNESVRPSFSAPCGKFGRVPSSIFEIISENGSSLNEAFPVKTLGRTRIILLSTFNTICRKVCRTNLYREHTERKHVRYGDLGGFTHSLWVNHHCCTAFSVFTVSFPGRRQTRQTSTTFAINGNVELIKDYLSGPKRAEENTYPKVRCDQFVRLKVIKPLSHIQQLRG